MSVGSGVIWMEGSLCRAKRQVAQCRRGFSIPKWDNKCRTICIAYFGHARRGLGSGVAV